MRTEPKRAWWLIAAAAVVAVVVALTVGRIFQHTLSNIWFGYAWSSDKGNGPEALQQTVIYAAVGALVYPPTRKAIERFVERHKDDLKTQRDELESEAKKDRERIAAKAEAERADLLRHVQHVIKYHPNIPNELDDDPKQRPERRRGPDGRFIKKETTNDGQP